MSDDEFKGVHGALQRHFLHKIPPSTMFLSFILLYAIALFFLHALVAQPLRDWAGLNYSTDEISGVTSRAILSFMTLVGLMFAILVGQASTLSLNRLRDVQVSINELAGSMGAMLTTAHALGEQTQMKIARTMGNYIDTVIDFDVENFEKLSEKEYRMGDFIVRTIREGATDGVHDEFDNAVTESLMHGLHSWSHARIAWQTAVINKLNPLRLINLEFLGLIAMILMFMIAMDDPALEAILFALTAAAMRMVLLLVVLTDSYGHSTRVSSVVNLNYDILIGVQRRAQWILERYGPLVE